MNTEDNADFLDGVVDETVDELTAITPAPVAESDSRPIWARRTVLKAAALGAAAAALVSKTPGGLRLGPLPAAADDLSTFQCTAGDVEIIGAGQIINEPCSCNGTFNAQVSFTVRNNAASDRGCITLHLVPNAAFPTQVDVLLQGSIAGKTTQTMTGTIQNYPCGAGLQCFGSASGDGRRRCEPGECSTVSWTVPGQDTCPPDKQISSKCRHQQICIQGRGNTTVDCDLSTQGGQSNCSVPCGGKATVRVCTTNPAILGPFTFTLGAQSFGPTTDKCHDFTVLSITQNTTLTATVTDKDGCAKSASVTLTTTPITVKITDVTGDESCGNGNLTIKAEASGSGGCSFEWKIGNAVVSGQTTDTLSYTANPDSSPHTVSVKATCGGCTSGSDSITISQCITTTVTGLDSVGSAQVTRARNATASASGAGAGQKSKKQQSGPRRTKGKRRTPKRGDAKHHSRSAHSAKKRAHQRRHK